MASTARQTLTQTWAAITSAGETPVLIQMLNVGSGSIEIAVGTGTPSNDTGHVLDKESPSISLAELGGSDVVYGRSVVNASEPIAVTK